MKTDYLVIGSGIAGLRAAIELAKKGEKVTLITKSKVEDANTYYAQGGAAAVDPARVKTGADSFDSHEKDTIVAGAGLCDEYVVENFVKNAFSGAMQFLIENGVKFTQNGKSYPYELHQEGGHEHERIYCIGDYTGKAIEEKLAEVAKSLPNITILENHAAINLITLNRISNVKVPVDKCLGAYVLDKTNETVLKIEAKNTFLATGGAGRVFQYTSNPDVATGDGIAMAYKAGARIANMEFFQFHPTVLYEPHPKDPSEKRFLITEALRGEKVGALLTLEQNSLDDLVLKYDARGSHATRDIVSRAIDTELKSKGLKHVWLNITTKVTGKDEAYLKQNYPMIFQKCMEKGINMALDPVPVVPAAHYMCGGVVVNEFGLTDINNLYAIGEVACTGLMGANRLASNSLTEGALYGKLAVEHALANSRIQKSHNFEIPEWRTGKVDTKADTATVNQFWDETRSLMTNMCGIDRNEQRLSLAVKMMTSLVEAGDEIYRNFYPTQEIINLRNLSLVGMLIAKSAYERRESRGCHFRSDFPHPNPEMASYTIIKRN
jgi:L-aspartate oxidase